MTRLRVGFLFNHAAGHQVAHSLPIALSLARSGEAVDVTLFVSGGAAEAEVRRLWAMAGHAPEDHRIVVLHPAHAAARWLAQLSGGAIPADRVSILARNRDRFVELDALIVPEKTSTMLKTRFGLKGVALVHTRHGAGDRAIGFDKASARFDLVLMSGAKIRDRLAAAGLLRKDGHAIVGYPKFDSIGTAPDRTPLFDNGRPTVLYNPHPSPALSSWYRHGPAILEWFARQDRFNLVFAPHVMLFAKRWTIGLSPPSLAHVPPVPRMAGQKPHILIDTGSRASLDMTYTNRADIYLGDASSQVYEFLRFPRPCLFWNARGHAWQDNPDFAHWQAGPVVTDLGEMERALEAAVENPDSHRAEQERLFAYSFDLDERPSADRAAKAIVGWLRARQTGEST